MSPQEIKTRMKEKKLSQARLARRIRLSPTAVNFFVNGKLTSEKLEKRIARALDLTIEQVRVRTVVQ